MTTIDGIRRRLRIRIPSPAEFWRHTALRHQEWQVGVVPKRGVTTICGAFVAEGSFCWRRELDGKWQYKVMTEAEQIEAAWFSANGV